MADRLDVLSVNKFDGNNFHQWKFQIICALKAKGLFEITKEKMPTIDETRTDSKKQYDEWVKKDANAMFLLTSVMNYNQITLIENCDTSKEIMDKLNSIYEQKTETNKLLVHERFHQYKMDTSGTIAQHIAKVENLARQIREAGDSISDAAIMNKVLSSLPSKYRSFRQAWLSLDENKQTIINLTARLLDEENSLTTVEESEIALATTRKWNEKYQNKRKDGDNSQARSRKEERTCYICQKKGHIAKESLTIQNKVK